MRASAWTGAPTYGGRVTSGGLSVEENPQKAQISTVLREKCQPFCSTDSMGQDVRFPATPLTRFSVPLLFKGLSINEIRPGAKNFSNSQGKVRPLTSEEIALGESYAWTAA